MSEFKGTKGEWVVMEGRSLICVQIGDLKFGISNVNNENRANALLISKSPEMLEMLKSILASEHLKGTIEESKVKQLIKSATEG